MALITINTPAAQDARILTAFGLRLNLKDAGGVARDATPAEVKAHIVFLITQLVQEAERAAARQAAEASITPVTPT